ncbi:hypothetical protein [Ensifer sp. BR816]|uniref:hypothetical protein n=1 Tax=Rhizobium sp. (strain BR816) TaxID=1057002 RepID=UPI00037F6BC1|nr:hypothetical protein [Ensifer sp. BR816]
MYSELLGAIANVAAILTALVAVVAYGHFLWERRQKRRRLESHLRDERHVGYTGERSLLHLTAHLGMSEAEVVDAAFRSKVIRRRVSADDQGRPHQLLLVYETGDIEEDYPTQPGRARF